MDFLKPMFIIYLFLLTAFDQSSELKVGDVAPNFSLKSTEGKMITLETKASIKGYIILFTSNSCPYSTLYEDRIIEVHSKYADLGYPVLAIQPNSPKLSPDDSFEKMKVKMDEKAFPFPYLMDTNEQETSKAYGASNTPQVFVLQKSTDNSFTVAYIGAIDNNSRNPEAASKKYLELAINELLAGLPVSTKNTKSIGCTIKN